MELSEDQKPAALEFLASHNQPLPGWMREIKAFGLAEQVPIVSDEVGEFLRLLCRLLRPAQILEIGTGISYSTHWMLLGHPQAQVTAVDMNHERMAYCRLALAQSGFAGQVTLVQAWADEFFPRFGQEVDFIFQDSMKKGYAGMLDQCYNCLKPGGVLVADNIFFGGKVFGLAPGQVKKYQAGVSALLDFSQQMTQHPGFACSFLNIGDGLLVAQKLLT